jgi:aminoethylphosphonate catabolism LysR family transcriptional regulator
MQLTWLKAFHLVAAEGGFTAASRALNVSQPTVSSHVKALEQYFKVELFFRRGHSTALTPLGQSLYLITSGMFGHEEEAFAFLRAAKTAGQGELRLTAVGPYDVMTLAASISRKFPKLRVNVSLGHAPGVLQELSGFKSDIALLANAPADPEFHSVPFARHRVLVMVNREHRLARRRRPALSIRELAGERCVMREPLSTTRQAFERACKENGVVTDIVMEINSREAVIEAVSLGLGFSVIAESEFNGHPKLRALTLSDAEMSVCSFLVCLTERRERPLIRIAYDLAADSSRPGAAHTSERLSA